MINAALTNGLPRVLTALALARQVGVRLDRIFNYSWQECLPDSSPLQAASKIFDVDILPIPEPGKDQVECLRHVFDTIGDVNNLLAVYRPLGSDGAKDREIIGMIRPKRTYGFLEGLVVNILKKQNDAFPQNLYTEGLYADARIFDLLKRYHRELCDVISHKIEQNYFESVESEFRSSEWYQAHIADLRKFLRSDYSLLICPYVNNRSLIMTMAEHAIMLARAAKAVLNKGERLYVKLHPLESWEVGLLLRELLADRADRIYISDFQKDAMIPLDLICADQPPKTVYAVSSTSILSFIARDIPVFLLDSGTDHYKHEDLGNCCPDIRLPKLSFDCKDLCIAPLREIAFKTIRKVNKDKRFRRKIFFGLGKQGKDILEAMDSYYGNDEDLYVDLVMDDSGGCDGFRRWRVYRPESVTWLPGDVVLLATDTHQNTLRHRLKELGYMGHIVDLF